MSKPQSADAQAQSANTTENAGTLDRRRFLGVATGAALGLGTAMAEAAPPIKKSA